MATPPLFGLILSGSPLITTPSSQPSPSSYLYTLPQPSPQSSQQPSSSSSSSSSSTHLTIVLLNPLPPSTAAAIYLSSPTSPSTFTFLGGIGPGKESAVFKLSSPSPSSTTRSSSTSSPPSLLNIGIEIEPAEAVASRLQALEAERESRREQGRITTSVLAQRIIQNAFNFLASFSGQVGPGGVEVVPLKAFEEWWKKFEARVRADPSFLERQGSD